MTSYNAGQFEQVISQLRWRTDEPRWSKSIPEHKLMPSWTGHSLHRRFLVPRASPCTPCSVSLAGHMPETHFNLAVRVATIYAFAGSARLFMLTLLRSPWFRCHRVRAFNSLFSTVARPLIMGPLTRISCAFPETGKRRPVASGRAFTLGLAPDRGMLGSAVPVGSLLDLAMLRSHGARPMRQLRSPFEACRIDP